MSKQHGNRTPLWVILGFAFLVAVALASALLVIEFQGLIRTADGHAAASRCKTRAEVRRTLSNFREKRAARSVYEYYWPRWRLPGMSDDDCVMVVYDRRGRVVSVHHMD